ncbi:hypothetical protein [Mycobacterium marinum]|uniref:hypothetical protein n=1 Tax=Mycobacterium marinum TaxID=1781 RepID=UPI0019249987|nr:hypothetical protein [Mycobacterium marinum]QQW33204.1 hypothetical protein HXW97_04650 [Mycobacterium marinum]
MIPPEAEERFQRYLELTVEYNVAIEAAGDSPWFADSEKLAALERSGMAGIATAEDIGKRRALFMRRYTRPAPPAGLTNDLAVIRRSHTAVAEQVAA